jgi:hypothetical protein
VHEQLIAYLTFSSEMVIGPAMMALTHLSLIPVMKEVIVSGRVLEPLLKVLATSQSPLTLALGCKLLASLALHFPNKASIVSSGCFHSVVDMILGTGKRGMGSTREYPYSKWDNIPGNLLFAFSDLVQS